MIADNSKEQQLNIKIAGVAVCVRHTCPLTEWSCGGHITAEKPRFTVFASPEEVLEERARCKGVYSLDDCQSNCLYRGVALGMLNYDAFLMHAAVVAVDGEAYAFTAPGGTGKSTHVNNWLKYFGGRAYVLNGDKPIIRYMGESGRFFACGTPWRGKERLGVAENIPLKAVCVLHRGEDNAIAPADSSTVLNELFVQLLPPKTAEQAVKQLDLLDRLVKTVPIYNLKCNMSVASAEVAYNGMN